MRAAILSFDTTLSFLASSAGFRRRRVGGGELGGERVGKDVRGGGGAPERTEERDSVGRQNSSMVRLPPTGRSS